MRMKKLLAMCLATVMSLSLVACGGGQKNDSNGGGTDNTSSAAPSTTSTGTPGEDTNTDNSTTSDVKLTVSIWDTNQQAGLQEILNDFTAQTGVKAEIQVITWDEYWTMLEAAATGGSLPDVFWMHSNESQRYMENGLLLDLSDKITGSDKIDITKYPQDIVDLYSFDSKQYAIPKDIDTIALWYNKTLFDEAGVKYPDENWTWDDFYKAAKKLTNKDKGIYGTAWNTTNNQDGFYNIIYNFGGKVISDDKKTSGFDDPKTIEAMEYVGKFIDEGIAPDLQTISENKSNVLFEAGKVAMITQGSWMIPEFAQNEYANENCDVAVLPKTKDGSRKSIYNGLGWAAAANGSHTEEAWKLIEYLGSKEAQEKQAELGVTMSAYEGTSEAWVKSKPQFNLQAHLDMMNDLVIRPYSKKTVIWEDMISEKLKAAWTGEKPMADVCKEIAESMNASLAEE